MDPIDAQKFIDRILPIDPCNCTETLIKRMNRNKVKCEGVMIVSAPDGHKRVGLHTVFGGLLHGSKLNRGLVQFNFCPFCGVQLVKMEDNHVSPSDN